MQYDLVFEGGGAKGVVFVGAMQAFEAAGHTFKRLVGTSAGAITATLLAAGYNSQTMLPAVNEKLSDGRPRFSSFMDIPGDFDEETVMRSLSYHILSQIDLPYIPDSIEKHVDRIIVEALMEIPVYRNIFSFIERGGWFAGEMFLLWLKEKLDADGRRLGNSTLAQFHQKRPDTELTVIAVDSTSNQRLLLNHRSAPDLPVMWAVRMSMSIPFLWQEVIWKPEWGLYRGHDLSDHAIVDGGLLSNFAVDILVSKDDIIREIMGTEADAVPNVIGLLIDETLPVPNAPDPPSAQGSLENILPPMDIKQLQTVRRITRLVDTLTTANDKYVITEYKDNVCRLPAQGYGTTEFDMSDGRVEALLAAGRETMQTFLQKE